MKLKPSEVHDVLKFVRYLRNPQNATILKFLQAIQLLNWQKKNLHTDIEDNINGSGK
jgi:hypothetical protein